MYLLAQFIEEKIHTAAVQTIIIVHISKGSNSIHTETKHYCQVYLPYYIITNDATYRKQGTTCTFLDRSQRTNTKDV